MTTQGAKVKRPAFGPLGFVLLLVLFLVLPAVTASCSTPPDAKAGQGTIEVSVSGADVVLGSAPSVDLTGAFRPPSPEVEASLTEGVTPGSDVRAVAIALVAVLLLGLGLLFVRAWRLRTWLALGLAALAAALVTLAELLLVSHLTTKAEEIAAFTIYLPDTQGIDVVGRAGEFVHNGLGFWLTAAGAAAIAGVNLWLLARRRPESAQGPGPGQSS